MRQKGEHWQVNEECIVNTAVCQRAHLNWAEATSNREKLSLQCELYLSEDFR